MKGIKEGGRRLREKSIGTGLAGREKRVKEVPGAGAGPEGVGYDAALLLEHLDGRGRRPSRSSRPQVWKSVFSRSSTRQHVDKSLYQYGRCQTNDFRSKSWPSSEP
jgi:hypothetical protein